MAQIRIQALRELLALADVAGINERVLRQAAAEIIDLIDAAALADTRKLATLERGRRILRLGELPRAICCERLGISTQQYNRAKRAYRDSRHSDAVEAMQATKEIA
jgi:hypothetical protein